MNNTTENPNNYSSEEINAYGKEVFCAINRSTIVCSWGARNYKIQLFNGMPCLSFKVNGLLFKGVVNIAINRASDLFEVYYTNTKSVDKLVPNKEVYIEDLISIIDSKVERKPETTDEEYKKSVNSVEYKI